VRLNQAREDVQKYKSLLQKAQADAKVVFLIIADYFFIVFAADLISILSQLVHLVDCYCCKSTTDAASRQRLRSASYHQLIVPQHHRTMLGCQAFSVAGPTPWNSLPDYLRDPSLSKDTFM